jgi:tripartite-type tricarboxylate transporter receptor subunit TctC
MLAVSAHSVATAPEVPTFRSSASRQQRHGLLRFIPPRNAAPAINRLRQRSRGNPVPEVSERLRALGLEPVGSTPDELARRIEEDIAKWGPAVKASGFRAAD